MIQRLNINYDCNGLTYSVSVPTEDENLPYNLAEAFAHIIKQSDTNENIVIQSLIEEFGYNEKQKGGEQ